MNRQTEIKIGTEIETVTRIETKVDRSSLGTVQAKAARRTVSASRADRAVERAGRVRNEISRRRGG